MDQEETQQRRHPPQPRSGGKLVTLEEILTERPFKCRKPGEEEEEESDWEDRVIARQMGDGELVTRARRAKRK